METIVNQYHDMNLLLNEFSSVELGIIKIKMKLYMLCLQTHIFLTFQNYAFTYTYISIHTQYVYCNFYMYLAARLLVPNSLA